MILIGIKREEMQLKCFSAVIKPYKVYFQGKLSQTLTALTTSVLKKIALKKYTFLLLLDVVAKGCYHNIRSDKEAIDNTYGTLCKY